MIDVLKRLAELDSQNPNIVKESKIDECGMMPEMGLPMSAPQQPSMPASLNITAGSGEELSDMIKAIATLAGVKPVGADDLGVEHEPSAMVATPIMGAGAPETAGDSMRGVIDKMNDASGEEDEKKETDEGEEPDQFGIPGVNNTGNNPNKQKPFDANEFAHQENQPGVGDRMDGNMPKGRATFESLMDQYKKFVAEGDDMTNKTGYSPEMQERIKMATPQQLSQMAHELAGDPSHYSAEYKKLEATQSWLRGTTKHEEGISEDDEEDLDQFVNGNRPNFNGTDEEDFDKAQQMFVNFLKKKGIDVDNINDEAYPVLVAMCQGKMCAWYDLENAHGYVAGTTQAESYSKKKVAESSDSYGELLSHYPKEVQDFKDGGDLDYDLESALWDYHFNNGDIRNYDADASEYIGQNLADYLGIDEAYGRRGSSGSYNPDAWAQKDWNAGKAADDDFRNRERNAGVENESPNNFQVTINGKPWKVFAGKNPPDSMEERQHLSSMKKWADGKSTATGKKWDVYLTGAPASA